MKQILQNLKTGEIDIADIPVPAVKSGHLLIRTSRTLISLGTEKMLLNFGRAGFIEKARQQPDRVKQVLQKIKTDGLVPTVNAVFQKLDQPLPLGYSNAGTVIEVGKGVIGFRTGDRVVTNGNHAEIVCIPENLCAKIPDLVNDSTAAFTVVAAIALQGIRLVNPTLGESIAVSGLGLIGLLTCQILLANGCRVIGFDFDETKIALARKYGVEAHKLGDGVDPVSLAKTFSKGNGVDAVIITAATTSQDPIHQAPQMCRKRGRVILVGVVGLNLSRDDFYKKEISFQVSCSYGPGRYETEYEKKGLDYPIGYVRWTEARNFEAILDLMAAGRIKTDELVTKSVSISRAREVYDSIAAGDNALGIILEYDGSVDVTLKSVSLPGDARQPAKPAEPVLGFIGSGNFAASTLIPACKETIADLKTIASSGGVSGTHVGKKTGFKISTTDPEIIFADPEINGVIITTQHNSHAFFVKKALEARKAVFVEKPLCLDESELEEIVQLYGKYVDSPKPLLMVGFNRRFSPLTEKCKRLLGSITEPKSFIMTVNAGSIPPEHWTQDLEAGGGRIIGEACHFIDLLRFLSGSPIEKVGAINLRNPACKTPPDVVTINLSFEDGSIGTIHYFANGHKDFPKERLEIFCGGCILQLDNFRTLAGFGWPAFTSEKLWTQDKGHQSCIKAFVSAMESGAPSPIPFEEIIEVTKAAFAATKE